MNYKKIFLSIILFGIISTVCLYKASLKIATYQSPNKNYELIVQRRLINTFLMTMPGNGGSSSPVEVVLINAKGKVIGRSTSNSRCGVLKYDIEIKWDVKNHEVSYSKARTINLKTGKVEC